MKYYELLFILPGTLAEDEVGASVKEVKDLVEKAGGQGIKVQDLGKSRIAYPIKHIRYGYFQLCQFQAEPKSVVEIKDKLRLMANLLRSVVKNVKTEGGVFEKISAISDVLVREPNAPRSNIGEERRPEIKVEEHISASHHIDSPEKPSRKKIKVKTETKAENIKMEDIDKKLDELLETNIADV